MIDQPEPLLVGSQTGQAFRQLQSKIAKVHGRAAVGHQVQETASAAKLLQSGKRLVVLRVDREDLPVLGRGLLEVAAAMKGPPQLKGRTDGPRPQGGNLAPNLDRLVKPALAQ